MKRREFLGRAAATLPLLPLVGCGGGGGSPSPTPSSSPGALPTGLDLPDLPRLPNTGGPGTFQSQITAGRSGIAFTSGVNTEAWAYNGAVPGPLIELHEGDRFRVNFHNALSQESNIHWHGLLVPPEMDGNPWTSCPRAAASPTTSTSCPAPPVPTGTPAPAPVSRAGVPRPRRDVIVRSGADPSPPTSPRSTVHHRHAPRRDGVIPTTRTATRSTAARATHLVNGRERPVYPHSARVQQRWRIVNAMSARPLKLARQGHTFQVIGTDGGLLEAPVAMGEVFLAPAERAEVVVTATQAAGTNVSLVALPYDRQKVVGAAISPEITIATLSYTSDSPLASSALPGFLRPIAPLGQPRAIQQAAFTRSAPQGAITFASTGALRPRAHRHDRPRGAGESGRSRTSRAWTSLHCTAASSSDQPHARRGHGARAVPGLEGHLQRDRRRDGPFRMVQSFRGLRVFHCHSWSTSRTG